SSKTEVDAFWERKKPKSSLRRKTALDKKYEEEPVTSLSTNNKRRRQKAVEKGREVLDLEGTPESSHTALPRADRTRKPPSYYSDIEHGRGRNHRATTPSSPNLLVHGGKENEGEDSQGRTIGVGDLEPQNDKTYWTEEEDDDDDYFADAAQPDDQTRYEMALLTLPLGKSWGPRTYGIRSTLCTLRLICGCCTTSYAVLGGCTSSGSIHIPYSQI
ncbi:hypothetical protein N7489_006786, partial [Penicillium chrysogenum]